MRTLLILVLTGCTFDAASKVDGTDTASEADPGDVETADDEDDTASPEEDLSTIDNDEDGYTENQGDCDDEDEDIFPGAEDVCDGASNDCDEEIDEDAIDDFEPNDSVHWSLGLVSDDPISLDAFLHSEDDVDRFDYTIDDGWVDLVVGLRVSLTGFSSEIVYRMTIVHVDSDEKVFDDFKEAGETELVYEHNDTVFGDESGVYQVQIKSLDGFGCEDPYTLTISEDSFLP